MLRKNRAEDEAELQCMPKEVLGMGSFGHVLTIRYPALGQIKVVLKEHGLGQKAL